MFQKAGCASDEHSTECSTTGLSKASSASTTPSIPSVPSVSLEKPEESRTFAEIAAALSEAINVQESIAKHPEPEPEQKLPELNLKMHLLYQRCMNH